MTSNYILLQILKLGGLKTYLEYFDRYHNYYFRFKPYYLRFYINIPLRYVRSLDILKWKWSFWKIQKQETQYGHTFYTATVDNFLIKISPVHNLKSKFCIRLFKIKNSLNRLINLCACFVVPLNDISGRKCGHPEMDHITSGPLSSSRTYTNVFSAAPSLELLNRFLFISSYSEVSTYFQIYSVQNKMKFGKNYRGYRKFMAFSCECWTKAVSHSMVIKFRINITDIFLPMVYIIRSNFFF